MLGPWFHSIGQRIGEWFESNRVRRWAFSLAFGLIVIATYYAIRQIVPARYELYNEVVVVLFIIVSVLLLFPARERILSRFLRRYEYTSFFGHDFHHLELMARQFTVDRMIEDIVPELLEWLGVKNAQLAILEPDRRHFRVREYRNGDLEPDQHRLERATDLTRLLRNGHTLTTLDHALPQSTLDVMEKNEAAVIHPFLYKRWLSGFLILNEIPRNQYAERALAFFGNKAAVSIQNDLLSKRVIDSRLYDKEHSTARRIQRTLHRSHVPDIPGFRLNKSESTSQRTILEFFRVPDGHWYMVAISSERITGAAGLVVYGVLGYLYSFIHREENISIHRLMTELKRDPEYNTNEYRIDLLIGEIEENQPGIVILSEGQHYTFRKKKERRNLISPGWRNFVDLESGEEYWLSYQGEELIAIEYLDWSKSELMLTSSGDQAP